MYVKTLQIDTHRSKNLWKVEAWVGSTCSVLDQLTRRRSSVIFKIESSCIHRLLCNLWGVDLHDKPVKIERRTKTHPLRVPEKEVEYEVWWPVNNLEEVQEEDNSVIVVDLPVSLQYIEHFETKNEQRRFILFQSSTIFGRRGQTIYISNKLKKVYAITQWTLTTLKKITNFHLYVGLLIYFRCCRSQMNDDLDLS